MNIIEIGESNYQDYTNLDIVAFSYAGDGAMGEKGAIYIIDRDGQIYHANYCMADNIIDPNHIKDIIPVFGNLSSALLDSETQNANWVIEDLGFGNTLYMIREISDDFNKLVKEGDYQGFGVLFQHWPGIVLGLLGKEESNLTMNEIWGE